MSVDQHLPVIRVLRNLGGVVTYHVSIAHALGNDVASALFVSNFLFWEGRQADPEGWIFKTQDEITAETGMKRGDQEGARKRLRALGVLEDEVRGVPGKLHYRFDWDALNTILSDHFMENEARTAHQGKRMQAQVNTSPPIIHTMASIFSEVYLQVADTEFVWGAKTQRGRHFGNLKKLHDCIRDAVIGKKNRQAARNNAGILPVDFQATATDEEIVASWQIFLEQLPDWYRNKRLSPDTLYSDFNKIYLEIQTNATNAHKSAGKPAGARQPRTSLKDSL